MDLYIKRHICCLNSNISVLTLIVDLYINTPETFGIYEGHVCIMSVNDKNSLCILVDLTVMMTQAASGTTSNNVNIYNILC